MNNEDRKRKAELIGLIMMHCAAQNEMYENELKKRDDGYEPKTDIFNALTVAEIHAGGMDVAAITAAILAGAKNDMLNDAVASLTDLVVALKYKAQFYDTKREPDNEPVKILNMVYNASLDVVYDALCNGDVPSDIAEKVCDFIYE